MSFKNTMKTGFIGFIYTPPAEIVEPLAYLKWQIGKVAELGGNVFHVSSPIPEDDRSLHELKEFIDSHGVELEIGVPWEAYKMTGPSAADARDIILKRIKMAQFLGVKIMRNGYGRLVVETSRYNKKIPLREHMQFLIDNLKEDAKIFADQGMYFAIENHLDFTGREYAEIFSAVNSPYIGSALDTANGFTVLTDANDDVEALAEFAITTHIKDMKIVDFNSGDNLMPFQPRGCSLGEGHVDIPHAIDLLDQRSPHANGLHLIIEQGWLEYAEGIDHKVQDKAALEKGMKYLQNLLRQ